MRIGVSLREPAGPDAIRRLHEQVAQAAQDGFSSAWLSNIFGFDALTALAVTGHGVDGIELGTAVVPTYPRHPAALAQQALTASAALGGRLVLGIGLSHKIVIEDMYGYDYGQPQHLLAEGGQQHRDGAGPWRAQPDVRAHRGAGDIGLLAVQQRQQHGQVLAHVPERLAVVVAVHVLDHDLV